MVWLALSLALAADEDIKINEVLVNVPSTDDGLEWVELINTSTTDTVDLTGWTLERATTAGGWSARFTFPAESLAPGELLTVGGYSTSADLTLTSPDVLDFGNASSNGDGVRIRTSLGQLIDTVVYGPNNDQGILGDDLSPAAPAAGPGEDESIGRVPDGADTDDSSVDFQLFSTPTFGQPNGGIVDTSVPTDTGDTGPVGGGELVINEFLPDVTGGDAGFEFVEIKNTGSSSASLQGLVIESSTTGSSWSDAYTFGNETLSAGERFVVGGEFVTSADANLPTGQTLGLPNASSSGDGVRLVLSNGTVLDTVVYGPNNSDGFLDDLGGTAAPAPSPSSDQSLSRFPDGSDTDDSSVDFQITAVSPGSTNIGVTCGSDASQAAGLVINELMPNPDSPGGDDGFEWVELFNDSGASLDLSGWGVDTGTSDWGTVGILPQGTVLADQEFLVVAQSTSALTVSLTVVSGFAMGNAGSTNADGVRLIDCDGAPVDTVIYGGSNGDAWVDDTGSVTTSLAPPAGSGVSLARVGDGVDSNQSGADFTEATVPTPGVSNATAPQDCGSGAGVVINELFPDPDGTDDPFEWVELYHSGSEPQELQGWALQGGANDWSEQHNFEGTLEIQPGEHLVIGESMASVLDVLAEINLGNGANSDALRLVDCNGQVADTVVYGTPNEDGWVDDNGDLAVSLGPVPDAAESLQRVEDGFDTQASGIDFVVTETPSPGEENPVIAPIDCTPSGGDVVINEVFPDPEGTDSGAEWIELYNRGDAAAEVGGWQLAFATNSAVNSFAVIDTVLPEGTSIEPGGFLLIGGALVKEAQVNVDLSIGNGTNADGVRLFDCLGARVDTIVYGDEGNVDGIVDDNDSIEEDLPAPGEEESVARVNDGVDTDGVGDLKVDDTPTPGATNFEPGDDVEDDELSQGCGCGSSAPDSDAPGGGCSTVPTGLSGLAVGILALARRRRG